MGGYSRKGEKSSVAEQVSREATGMKIRYRLAGPDNAKLCRSLDSILSARDAPDRQSQGGNDLVCALEISLWLLDEGQICIQKWKGGIQMEVVAFRGTRFLGGKKS